MRELASRYLSDSLSRRDFLDGLTKNWRYPGWRVTWTVGPKSVIEAVASAGSFLDGGGSKPMQRIHDAGLYAMINAEVISVGQVTAAGEIHQLITDQGNAGHPHRDDLFNPLVTLAGVGCGPDKRYGQITVIDLSSPSLK